MKMNILFSVHLMPPQHSCGGEMYILHLAEYLISKGHEVRVLLHQAHTYGIRNFYTYKGITVFPPTSGMVDILMNWSSHVITHLEYTSFTIEQAKKWHKPVFFISHNTWDYQCVSNSIMPVNVIYNTECMQKTLNYNQRSAVLHPPLSLNKVDNSICAENNEFITLINCNERKGGAIVSRIAEMMSEKSFLFVEGGYDEQIIPDLPNVTVVKNSDDILPVYRQTRLLLMPSAYESYGMACSEAIANGIPVICMPTPGLKENAGNAAVYIDSPNIRKWMENHEEPAMDYLTNYDINLWVDAINKFDNKIYYSKISNNCKDRAKELNPINELQMIEQFILAA